MAVQALNGFMVEGKKLRVEQKPPKSAGKPYGAMA